MPTHNDPTNDVATDVADGAVGKLHAAVAAYHERRCAIARSDGEETPPTPFL